MIRSRSDVARLSRTALLGTALLTSACSVSAKLRYAEVRVPVTRPAEFSLSQRVRSIAVTGFVVRGEAQGLDARAISRGIEDGVAGGVRDQGFLEVIERNQLEHAMSELERGFEDAFDQASAAEFGKLAQAQAVVFGEVAVRVPENVGPFQTESATSRHAREDWARRKGTWDSSEDRQYNAWLQRKKRWDNAENSRAFTSALEHGAWVLAAMGNNGVHPEGQPEPQTYQARPYTEPEYLKRPFLEAEPAVRMETWAFIEQRPSLQITVKMVDVESGVVVGSTGFALSGKTHRDENPNQSGLRREDPDKLIQPLIPEVVRRLTTAITPYRSVVTRQATSLSGGPFEERLSRSVRYIRQAAPELAEPILKGVHAEISGKKKPDRLARAAIENNWGIVAEAIGDFDTALEHYRRAIEDDPDNDVFVQHYSDLKRVAEEHARAVRQAGER